MTRHALPLLVDRLPVYADDKALRAAICPAADDGIWRSLTASPSFPRARPWGGRHVQSVVAWFDAYEAGGPAPAAERSDEERAEQWNAPVRRRRRPA